MKLDEAAVEKAVDAARKEHFDLGGREYTTRCVRAAIEAYLSVAGMGEDNPTCTGLSPAQIELLSNVRHWAKEERDQLRSTIADLTAEVERLRAALKPFATEAGAWDVTWYGEYRLPNTALTVADLRRARAALAGELLRQLAASTEKRVVVRSYPACNSD